MVNDEIIDEDFWRYGVLNVYNDIEMLYDSNHFIVKDGEHTLLFQGKGNKEITTIDDLPEYGNCRIEIEGEIMVEPVKSGVFKGRVLELNSSYNWRFEDYYLTYEHRK